LKEKGQKVQLLSLPTYRTSGIHAGKIREGMKNFTVGKKTSILVQVFDSGLFIGSHGGQPDPPEEGQ
jgi:hypothetical protein